MELGLGGRVALVTGAAKGIGRSVAERFAQEGCQLALVDSDEVDLARAARDLEASGTHVIAAAADVRDLNRAATIVGDVLDAFGRIDVLVCNAGITRDRVVWKMAESDWDDVIDVNLKGCFTYARAVAPVLRASAWGRIVAISSINGLRGKLGQSNYAASKAGLIGFCKSLARELGRYGVTVNVVAPGMVHTPLVDGLAPDVVERARGEAVDGRLAEPEEIADAVAFLSSERAAHITGQTLQVDGGQYI